MRDDGEIRNRGLEMIREKIEEWTDWPYFYQTFNYDECTGCPYPTFMHQSTGLEIIERFFQRCDENQSFIFSIEPVIVGDVKPCSYSELQKITDLKPERSILKTLSGRLFHGIISEGSEKRQAIVKTWDFLLPWGPYHAQRPSKFCDEIELFTDDKANTHPNLVKLHSYCYEMRLAAVYDEKFTRVLSDVLLSDDFGWDERIKVAIQLADLLAWLHEKGIAVGSVTGSCIMIDEDVNIKVFDFGYVSNHVNKDSEIPFKASVGTDAPEAGTGRRTMKSDVYVYGLLLLELITKKQFDFHAGPLAVKRSILDEAESGKNYLVHECFKGVGSKIASEFTDLVKLCTKFDPEERPTMKDVLDELKALQKGESRVEKRKRDENETEQKKRPLL